MRDGITTTESLKKITEPKPAEPNVVEYARIPLERYNELKHVQKTFASKFKEIEDIIKNMEKEIAQLKELNEKCRDRNYKYMRF